MDDQLKTLLTSNGIHQEVIDWLAGPSIGCVNVKLFANWCSQPDDVQSNILDHVISVKGSRAQSVARGRGLRRPRPQADLRRHRRGGLGGTSVDTSATKR